jgi:hypothetical protein
MQGYVLSRAEYAVGARYIIPPHTVGNPPILMQDYTLNRVEYTVGAVRHRALTYRGKLPNLDAGLYPQLGRICRRGTIHRALTIP